MQAPATISETGDQMVARITVPRLFDQEVVDRVDQVLRQAIERRRHLVIDITCVRFLSSAMLGRLVLLWQDLDVLHLRLALYGANAAIAEIMRISGLDHRIPRYSSEHEALQAIQRGHP